MDITGNSHKIIRTANRMFTGRRLIVSADELTSRVSTTELNETLDKLEKIEYSKENVAAKRYASNVLLATNMISVGIDVARLNVMLMIGQPKLTSEYIQASSRVGRSFPGVVFVQYDATKSRDRSHYERFRSYHESFLLQISVNIALTVGICTGIVFLFCGFYKTEIGIKNKFKE